MIIYLALLPAYECINCGLFKKYLVYGGCFYLLFFRIMNSNSVASSSIGRIGVSGSGCMNMFSACAPGGVTWVVA